MDNDPIGKSSGHALPRIDPESTSPAPQSQQAVPVQEAPAERRHRVASIDSNKFIQDCIGKLLIESMSTSVVLFYPSVEQFLNAKDQAIDLILYHSHAMDVTQPPDRKNIAEIHAGYPGVPLVVLSDADDAQQPKVIRALLDAGVFGVIATKTTGIAMSLAVINFVHAGGTFVPPELLSSAPHRRANVVSERVASSRLTSRQMAVLAHLDSGKANKVIAHELGLSESTVKVHVRNIMRKMNASNRTQAVYRARKIWNSEDQTPPSER